MVGVNCWLIFFKVSVERYSSYRGPNQSGNAYEIGHNPAGQGNRNLLAGQI